MKDIKKVIVISDLHLGGANHPTSPTPLISFFGDDDRFEDSIIVIAGDMLDSWAHPCEKVPPTYKKMIHHDEIWNQIIERAKKTPTYFINGNHDMDLDLYAIGITQITQITPFELFIKLDKKLYIDHGNCVDLFNAEGHSDDSSINYPLGYFKTRLNHSKKYNSEKEVVYPMQKDRFVTEAKKRVIKKLYDLEKNVGSLTKDGLDDLLYSISKMLRDGMKKDIQERFKVSDINDVTCTMNTGETNCYGKILENYKSFVYNFYHNCLLPSINQTDPLKVPWLDFANSIDVVRTGGLSWYAKSICESYKANKVVFGHTHMNQLIPAKIEKNIDGQSIVYANSGCWCENSIGPNVTSIEIDFVENELLSRNEIITAKLDS